MLVKFSCTMADIIDLNTSKLCLMSWMKQENEWDFSATSHGKGDIDGLGGTCKPRRREKKAHIIDPQTSLEFANCASEICPNINIIHCTTEIIENAKPTLDHSWMINGKTIPKLPGTRKVFHFLKRSMIMLLQC